jgi:rhodanese-related sulfurtransferase
MAKVLKQIDAAEAARMREAGAVMVDVREPYEFAGTRVPGSHNVALSQLDAAPLPEADGPAIVFFCASGNRTSVHAGRLAARAGAAEAYVMQGGIGAWGRAGLPLESGAAEEGAPDGSRAGFLARMFAR